MACRPKKIGVFLINKKSDIRTPQNGGYTNTSLACQETIHVLIIHNHIQFTYSSGCVNWLWLCMSKYVWSVCALPWVSEYVFACPPFLWV